MLYLPPLRRLLLPSLLCLAFILYYKSTVRLPTARQQLQSLLLRQPELTPSGIRISVNELANEHDGVDQIIIRNVSENHRSPPLHLYYKYDQPGDRSADGTEIRPSYAQPESNPHMAPLWRCPREPNTITDHIRLPNPVYNISLIVRNETENERKGFLNPAILSLPDWSENQYLLVSRVATDGSHMQNLMCEANICYTGGEENARRRERPCSSEDLELLGGAIGLRCVTPPMTLNVPPTPAYSCVEDTGPLMDIPGFHDPRVFWTGRGEPVMMVNSQSRYSCFGLWAIDLRRLHQPLDRLLASNPRVPSPGPLMSYPHLTELTRNPHKVRGPMEKNWMFFGDKHGSYIHYDMGSRKRTFAKLLGGGLTTVNLTDPNEMPCLRDAFNPDSSVGSWHQATNSLRLTLCDRGDPNCSPRTTNEVYFSIIHRKIKNPLDLPLRYERYFIVWSAQPPFSMLGVSRHPILMSNESTNGFEPEETWQDDPEQQRLIAAGREGKRHWARIFSYTVSIAWAWGRPVDAPEDKNFGYLNDEVILGIGVDDEGMVFSRVPARDLLQCLRACPARASVPLYSEEPDDGPAWLLSGPSPKPSIDDTTNPEAREAESEGVSRSAPETPGAAATVSVVEEARRDPEALVTSSATLPRTTAFQSDER